MTRICTTVGFFLFLSAFKLDAEERIISKADLTDRVLGFWNGQLLGNYVGFPFENLYRDEAIPILVERIYTADYDESIPLKIHDSDLSLIHI